VLEAPTHGLPHIFARLDQLPAAGTRPAGRVQLIAFEIGVHIDEMLLGLFDLTTGLNAKDREVCALGRSVRTWRRVSCHAELASSVVVVSKGSFVAGTLAGARTAPGDGAASSSRVST
jgi:hypothetical protein